MRFDALPRQESEARGVPLCGSHMDVARAQAACPAACHSSLRSQIIYCPAHSGGGQAANPTGDSFIP